jgi:hypothetical protein
MTVYCSKCGEELLGAVNRCWKCGQKFALPPEKDGRPPVRVALAAQGGEPLAAVLVEAGSADGLSAPVALPRIVRPTTARTMDLLEARLAGQMALGGACASLVLGVLSAILAWLWPPAAIIAVLGLGLGIWGLSSPRRGWALVGMLLCCLAIGLGTYNLARRAYIAYQQNKPIPVDMTEEP